MKQGFYELPDGERVALHEFMGNTNAHTELIKPDEFAELVLPANRYQTRFTVKNETSVAACLRLAGMLEQIMCLNFASAKNPGGGFLGGAEAQEESLARVTTLYSSLAKKEEFYRYHRSHKTLLYSDHMIYSPQVALFKNEAGAYLNTPLFISFITSAAANAGAIKRNEPQSLSRIEEVMQERIRKMLMLAAQRHKNLILGAWGCGVFANDPKMIAKLFHQALSGEFEGVFENVHFAVLSRNGIVLAPFEELFG